MIHECCRTESHRSLHHQLHIGLTGQCNTPKTSASTSVPTQAAVDHRSHPFKPRHLPNDRTENYKTPCQDYSICRPSSLSASSRSLRNTCAPHNTSQRSRGKLRRYPQRQSPVLPANTSRALPAASSSTDSSTSGTSKRLTTRVFRSSARLSTLLISSSGD